MSDTEALIAEAREASRADAWRYAGQLADALEQAIKDRRAVATLCDHSAEMLSHLVMDTAEDKAWSDRVIAHFRRLATAVRDDHHA